jgi:hypothetical protein
MPARRGTTAPQVNGALATLRRWLRSLPPTGPDGFEGLVATCLTRVTKLDIRLARSGAQHGRDGSSLSSDSFTVAVEAKRYAKSPTRHHLFGKVAESALAFRGRLDVWILCCTAEVSEGIANNLEEIAAAQNFDILLLDWSRSGLPRLAVLLAADPVAAGDWAARAHQPAPPLDVVAALTGIGADERFESALALLREALDRSLSGMGALQASTSRWIDEASADAGLSRERFGQSLPPRISRDGVVSRSTLLTQLDAAVAGAQGAQAVRNQDGVTIPQCVAVLGDEGAGKSWLAVDWWRQSHPRPAMVFVAGRRHAHVLSNLQQARAGLAQLLYEQHGASGASVEMWTRRLTRWATTETPTYPRLIVVLDGVNEEHRQDWAHAVTAYAREAAKLGGLLIVTCRTVFWQQHLEPRLTSSVKCTVCRVSGLDDAELEAVLGRPLRGIPPDVCDFLRSPRVARLARGIIARDTLVLEDLTIDRLLIEYHRARLEERGSLVAHNVAEFHQLLQAHARNWKENRSAFAPGAWREFSPVAQQLGPEHALRDLQDIVDGRFLTTLPSGPGQYQFKGEALPFALALLLLHELEPLDSRSTEEAVEHLEKWMEELGAFDRLSEILVAAFGLAALRGGQPANVMAALLTGLCGLQNLTLTALAALHAYVPLSPSVYLTVLEAEAASHSSSVREHVLVDAVRSRYADVGVTRAVVARVHVWLTRWNRAGHRLRNEEYEKSREVRISRALAEMTVAERELVRQWTLETDQPTEPAYSHLAVRLLPGLTMLPFARTVVGWAMRAAIGADDAGVAQDLSWLLALNVRDPQETADEITRHIRELIDVDAEAATPPMRRAAALALDITGNANAVAFADRFRWSWPPRNPFPRDFDCDTNPLDPSANECSNLRAIRTKVAEVGQLVPLGSLYNASAAFEWPGMQRAMARFAPAEIVGELRRLMSAPPPDTYAALREFAWALEDVAPLVDRGVADVIGTTLHRLLAGEPATSTNDGAERDAWWTATLLLTAMMPSLDAVDQLRWLVRMPVGMPLYTRLLRHAKPLSASDLERSLLSATAAFTAAHPTDAWPRHALIMSLLFIGSRSSEFTKAVQDTLRGLLASGDPDVVLRVAAPASRANTQALDDALLTLRAAPESPFACTEDRGARPAIAAALMRQPQLRALVEWSCDEVAWLAAHEDAKAISLLDAELLAMITQGEDHEQPRTADDRPVPKTRTSVRSAADSWWQWPPAESIPGFVERHRLAVADWLECLTAGQVRGVRARTSWLNVLLAEAMLPHDETLAVKALRECRAQDARIRINGIDVLHSAVFAGMGSSSRTLQDEVFADCVNDAQLEALVRAAEDAGRATLLDELVAGWLADGGIPSVAQALMVLGLRQRPEAGIDLLGRDWGAGFLGTVASHARHCAEQHRWARHWLALAADSSTPVDVWRYSELAVACADARLLDVRTSLPTATDVFKELLPELKDRLARAGESRTKARGDTLFGMKAGSFHESLIRNCRRNRAFR